jgi:hypothetical protein
MKITRDGQQTVPVSNLRPAHFFRITSHVDFVRTCLIVSARTRDHIKRRISKEGSDVDSWTVFGHQIFTY